jgi:hypothetical protein
LHAIRPCKQEQKGRKPHDHQRSEFHFSHEIENFDEMMNELSSATQLINKHTAPVARCVY